MFRLTALFAEFEWAMFQDRINAGLAGARAEGKHLDLPPGAPKRRQAKPNGAHAGGLGPQIGVCLCMTLRTRCVRFLAFRVGRVIRP